MIYWIFATIFLIIGVISSVAGVKLKKKRKADIPDDINNFTLKVSLGESLSAGAFFFSFLLAPVLIGYAVGAPVIIMGFIIYTIFAAAFGIVVALATDCGIIVVKDDNVTFHKWYKKDVTVSFAEITMVEYTYTSRGNSGLWHIYVNDEKVFVVKKFLYPEVFIRKLNRYHIRIKDKKII